MSASQPVEAPNGMTADRPAAFLPVTMAGLLFVFGLARGPPLLLAGGSAVRLLRAGFPVKVLGVVEYGGGLLPLPAAAYFACQGAVFAGLAVPLSFLFRSRRPATAAGRRQPRLIPNSGRSRVPSQLPAKANTIQTQPCRLPEAMPEKKAPILQPKASRAP